MFKRRTLPPPPTELESDPARQEAMAEREQDELYKKIRGMQMRRQADIPGGFEKGVDEGLPPSRRAFKGGTRGWWNTGKKSCIAAMFSLGAMQVLSLATAPEVQAGENLEVHDTVRSGGEVKRSEGAGLDLSGGP